MRTECDFLGEVEIPDGALYGVHAVRARENFPDETVFHREWYRAIGSTKLACYLTYRTFKAALLERFGRGGAGFPLIADEVLDALIGAAEEVASGQHFEHFVVPAICGGAGTSLNMNVNEILANRSLQLLGEAPGAYDRVDPLAHANVFQSTNDVMPTALKLAAMSLLDELAGRINALRLVIEALEQRHRHDLRVAYTQMQEAVPSSFGRLFSAFDDALSRDWWRVSKCCERIKVVNLGGSAIGTGITVPRFFVMEVVRTLQEVSGKAVTRGENLSDATSNLDCYVEVHAILKAHAVNLEKLSSDVRLLSSDLMGRAQLQLPQQQVGSSIMPGKVNPVVPEFVVSVAHRVYCNDSLIAGLCGQGCLELNAYLPTIGHALLESLKLLIAADRALKEKLFCGLVVRASEAVDWLYRSPAIATVLVPVVGYHRAAEAARLMRSQGLDIFAAAAQLGILDAARLTQLLKPENLLKAGYSMAEALAPDGGLDGA